MGDGSDDDPFYALLGDHADFVDKLTELEATLDEMIATREAREENRIILDESIRFFEDELLPVLAAEDQTILPPLEAVIRPDGTPVDRGAYQNHQKPRGVE